MKRIEILGLSTTYSDEGKGNVLLFLHGWGGSAKSFDSIKNLLPGRKICLDLWGFGGSSPPSEAWGVADYARAVYFSSESSISSRFRSFRIALAEELR